MDDGVAIVNMTTETKDKLPVTPVPMEPDLRKALYQDAEKLGRKLTKHIVMVLAEHSPAYKNRK